MTGLTLKWDGDAADLAVAGAGDPQAALRTALLISLFTDRRVEDDDLPAEFAGDRRGWWGDVSPPVAEDRIGSRLWLLARGRRSAETVRLARDYALEAVAWIEADGVGRVEVEAEAHGDSAILLGVYITRATGPGRQRFDFLWEPA
jgi:phage gp46-like protein